MNGKAETFRSNSTKNSHEDADTAELTLDINSSWLASCARQCMQLYVLRLSSGKYD